MGIAVGLTVGYTEEGTALGLADGYVKEEISLGANEDGFEVGVIVVGFVGPPEGDAEGSLDGEDVVGTTVGV